MHEIIEEYNFSKYADILANEEHAYFVYVPSNEPPGHGFVYLWLETQNESSRIVYVGKAGKRLIDRCKQHFGGFKGTSRSKTGARHSRNICNGIRAGRNYEVYFRKSDVQTILDEKVSMCSVEEESLILKVKPPWNSLKASEANQPTTFVEERQPTTNRVVPEDPDRLGCDMLNVQLDTRAHFIHCVMAESRAPLSPSEIGERAERLARGIMQVNPTTFSGGVTSSHLNTMKNKGFAERVERGGWQLTDAARLRIASACQD